jgi:transposase-like protein
MFNLHTFDSEFTSQQDCLNFLESVRWGTTPACTACGSVNPYKLKGGKNYKCRECDKFFNVLHGTIFENTKIPLVKWFKAILIFTSHKKGISSYQLGRDLGISQHSSWFVLSRVRNMLKNKGSFMLEGTVQIDCTFIGGKLHYKSNKKRKAMRAKYAGKVHNEDGKATVLGFLANGQVHHQVVQGEKPRFVIPIMRETVKEGSTIVTDELRAYKVLRDKYTHKTVNHGKSEYVRNGFSTNGIEGAFSQLKRGIYGIYHHASPKHLNRYCDEFSFRYNTRKETEVDRFKKALGQCDGSRLRYVDLTKEVSEV